jgi:hypothetical protein
VLRRLPFVGGRAESVSRRTLLRAAAPRRAIDRFFALLASVLVRNDAVIGQAAVRFEDLMQHVAARAAATESNLRGSVDDVWIAHMLVLFIRLRSHGAAYGSISL